MWELGHPPKQNENPCSNFSEQMGGFDAYGERAVRPLALGRKNWLFFGSPDGGKAGTILFSLVQACRGLGINPRDCLEDVMRRIMPHNSQKIYKLLPDYWQNSRSLNPSL